MSNGILIDRVLLDPTSVDMHDDMSVWQAAAECLHWAVTTAYLLPGEFPEILYNLNKVSFYAAQVDNGGHKQFAHNSGWQLDVIERVRIGLKEINATQFSAIYAEFRRLVDVESEVRNEILNQKFGNPPKAVAELDSRFYKLGGANKLVEHGAAWLRSLPNLALLSPDDLQKERDSIVARNTALEARRAQRISAQEAAEAANPVYVAARRLCVLTGLTFLRLTAGRHTGQPDTMRWGLMTATGIYFMVIGPEKAELQDRETGKVLGTVTLGTSV